MDESFFRVIDRTTGTSFSFDELDEAVDMRNSRQVAFRDHEIAIVEVRADGTETEL